MNSLFPRSITLCSLLLLALSAPAIAQSVKTIRTVPITTDNDRYALKMLQLANNHLDNKYQISSETGEQRTSARYVSDVMSNNIDIMWTATDMEMERDLLPVRIPLYKGMLGHRIFLIHKGDQYKFDQVKTFADLQKLKLGQGTTWADTKILESNGLQVVKTNKYKGLLYMLDGGRFDAFPRGVQEPWGEVNGTPGLELDIDKHIMLVYKMPFYMFVNKNNTQVAKDVELGLNRAIADGSFDKIFLAEPSVQKVIENADLKHRLVFQLQNPDLPKETPVNRPELWLDISNF